MDARVDAQCVAWDSSLCCTVFCQCCCQGTSAQSEVVQEVVTLQGKESSQDCCKLLWFHITYQQLFGRVAYGCAKNCSMNSMQLLSCAWFLVYTVPLEGLKASFTSVSSFHTSQHQSFLQPSSYVMAIWMLRARACALCCNGNQLDLRRVVL